MGIRNIPTENQTEAPSHLKLVTPLWPELEKTVDDNVELTCCIEGEPAHEIEWRHNNQVLPLNSSRIKVTNNNQTLVIRRVTLDDAGTYECIAHNSAGFLVSACELTVKENPRAQKPNILKEVEDVTIGEGGSFTLRCESTKSLMETETFAWFKDGQVVHEDDRHVWQQTSLEDRKRFSLLISGVRLSDAGVYECRVINFFGGPASTFAQVYVI